ncbi:LuxR C-terminal-related transcriptional regulator [Agromyces binzhouensis]|uniref:HTH luxR-type domain-containing protein n=1 Tax=Agromyces binzhouensis TaxID=1817495 RepID=A0A4V1QTG4_9MICO|nr:LuxR C-terminal-related transcriptional regulator [Agromyces binzhouensis]RXZ51803.1 hypothetical protein ESO86_00615 [Agromyces binzhouensis]
MTSPLPLVGRDAERAQLDRLLQPDGPFVVNVTGSEGVGKSALVERVLQRTTGRFADVQHLELRTEGIGDVMPAVRSFTARMPLSLPGGNRDRSLLVIHRGDPLASQAESLVRLAAQDGALTILVESVPELRAPGCAPVLVGPLEADAAAQLFRQAAASVGVDVGDGPEVDDRIRRICSSVDGNPLAIELAACRLPFIPLTHLDPLLSDPRRALDVLTAPIGAGDRARGVRDAVLTTHEMSSAAAQRLLELLSVFAGPFAIEAVEAVCEGLVASCYNPLGELLDLRLAELDSATTLGRYRLSRLVQGFARERLEASGHASEARDRHARHFSDRARRAAEAVEDADEDAALAIMGEDFPECLHALHWLIEHDAARALRLAADLGWEAQRRGTGDRVLHLLRHLLDAPGAGDPSARRDALIWSAQLESLTPDAQDKAGVIAARVAEALVLARDSGAPLPLLMALRTQFLAVSATRDVPAAFAACAEGMRLAGELGHTRWTGRFEVSASSMYGNLRRYDEAAGLATSGLARAIRSDDRRTVVFAALVLHSLPTGTLPDQDGRLRLEDVLEIARDLDDTPRELHVLAALALSAVDRGDAAAAASWLTMRQSALRRVDLLNGPTVSVMLAALIADIRGDHRVGARLHGAIASHVDAVLALAAPEHGERYRAAVDRFRATLGPAGFAAAVAGGQVLDREQTLGELGAYLRQIADVPTPAESAASPTTAIAPLTARELQVLELLTRGLRNKEIAVELRITPKSVMHHTSAVYRKLGVRTRAEAATKAATSGLVRFD